MKKTALLTICCAMLLIACNKKEGCSDYNAANYDPEVSPKNSSGCVYEGYITFFSSDTLDNGPIKVQVNNYDYGYITSSANITSCGQADGVHITISPGVYTYSLSDDSGLLENGNISVEYNACVLYDVP